MDWPEIPYPDWRETCSALQLYSQIVGKYRLARTPWLNHSWHATLYVGARGIGTGLVPDGPGIEILLDLIGHEVRGIAGDGRSDGFALASTNIADFHARFVDLVRNLGGDPRFHGVPNEVPDPMPFVEDRRSRPWDAAAVTRFHAALIRVERVLQLFRTAWLGKASPVHLFWGSFDLAVTRFSGRPAPLHPGGIPGLPDNVTREAYSHEVASAGFWPGGGGKDFAAFYAYAYPAPPGYSQAAIAPEAAAFDAGLGEFVLPYDAVRRAADPEADLLAFLETSYRAAADLGGWDRAALECPLGVPRRPRPL